MHANPGRAFFPGGQGRPEETARRSIVQLSNIKRS
jgi:hypothetical protein